VITPFWIKDRVRCELDAGHDGDCQINDWLGIKLKPGKTKFTITITRLADAPDISMSDKHSFIPRTSCPNGHDLAIWGYSGPGWQDAPRCRLCDDKQRRRQARPAALARWRAKENLSVDMRSHDSK
jgi:hypothetical protein